MSTFVYLKEDMPLDDNETIIDVNSIGIIEKDEGDSAVVFFISYDIRISLDKYLIEIFDPTETGDGFENKVCNVCHKLLPTNNFARNQNGVNNRIIRRPSCNNCREVIDGVNVNSAEHRRWMSKKPELQPFTCPICKKTTIPGLTSKIVLDHDHSTGKIRGWICDSCNTGIGRFKDSIELLETAIEYLKANQDEQ